MLAWYDQHGRQDLPWQNPREPYRVWISEIMLQQTQVQTVIPYFQRFMAKFPSLIDLANADEDDVLALWSGLGYYSRARNMHKSAKIIAKNYAGQIPPSLEILISLPGIGASTAAAITSQAFGQATPILDANVKRVLARYFQVEGLPNKGSVNTLLWDLARKCMPPNNSANYTQAIMDLGALICKPRKPLCIQCPINQDCLAFNNQVTDRFPEKKPKKMIPTEQQKFLILHNEKSEIFLEKRPPTGIWGGLWSLPSIALDDCPLSHIENNYLLKTNSLLELPLLKHRFSHFNLELHPVAIATVQTINTNTIKEPVGSWFSKQQLDHVGIAKPIHKILMAWFSTF